MPRFEPAGDAFQQASSSANVIHSPEQLGEPFPQYLVQPNPALPPVQLPDPAFSRLPITTLSSLCLTDVVTVAMTLKQSSPWLNWAICFA